GQRQAAIRGIANGATSMTARQMGGRRVWSQRTIRLGMGLGLAVMVGCGLGACAPNIVNNGFVMDEDALAQIRPGAQNREQVAQMLGSPSSVAVSDDQTWLYTHRRTSQRVQFFDPTVLDQDVIAITFDPASGQVAEVRRLSLSDGQNVEPVDRI